MLSKSINI